MNDGPAYERVAADLRDAILDGLVTGRLPSLPVLAGQYAVTPDIARRAVEVLRGEGLVVTRQGSGTYVRRFQRIIRRSPERLSAERWGAGRTILDADTGVRPRTVDVVVDEEPAPAYVADALGVERGTPVMTRSRRHRVDGKPVMISKSYLPLDIVGGTRVAYTDVGPGGTYARLAELGHAPYRFDESVIARAPLPDEVERLELGSAVGSIAIEMIRYAYTEVGRCVEVNRMVCDASVYTLMYSFNA